MNVERYLEPIGTKPFHCQFEQIAEKNQPIDSHSNIVSNRLRIAWLVQFCRHDDGHLCAKRCRARSGSIWTHCIQTDHDADEPSKDSIMDQLMSVVTQEISRSKPELVVETDFLQLWASRW